MHKKRKEQSVATPEFEALESRQMMSVSVAPSGGNDTAALQNAINNSAAGTTISLEAGTYHVSSMLNLDGHTIQGVAGQTTLQWTGGSNSFLINTGSNSELEGVTITGAGVQVTDSSSNVTITNNTIENTGGTGISAQGGSNNLQVTHNTVQNIGGYGMVLYSINQSNIDYNTITNIYEGIHAVNFLGTNAGNNCTVNYNTVTGITRHGIEIQNDWDNLSVGWNYVADFNVQPGGNSHMALSIATGPGAGGANAENVDIHNNVLLGTGPGIPSNPNYCFTAIEVMGDHSVVQDNFMANWGWTVLDGFTSNWSVINNTCVGITSMNGKDALPESNGVAPSVDSGNTYTESWNGSVPSAFSDAGANGTGSSTPVSSTPVSSTGTDTGSSGTASTSASSAVAAPTDLTATSPNSGEIDVSWKDPSGGKATYTVQIKSTHGQDPYVTVATLGAGSTGYNITGLTANWQYNVQVIATVNGQSSAPALVVDQVQQLGFTAVASNTPTETKVTGGSSAAASNSGTKKDAGSNSSSKDSTKTASSSASGAGSAAAAVKQTAAKATQAAAKATRLAAKTEKQTEKSAKKTAKSVSSAAPVAVAAAPGHGLLATFTKGHGAKKVVTSMVTGNVDYTLSGKSKTLPALSSPVGASNYTVDWTGEVEAPTTGKYRITGKANDGMRVWVDGKQVVDQNGRSADSDTGTIKLVAGKKYDIKVQYVQKTGAATAQLMWATKGVPREAIPDEDLYLPEAA